MKKYFPLLGTVFLSVFLSCSSWQRVRSVPTQDGFSISCRGDIQSCYREARKACPSGYEEVSRSDQSYSTMSLGTDSQENDPQATGAITNVPVEKHQLTIRCKPL